MRKDAWRMGFHLMPPTGWMNDPNGLCQFKGVYHVFHQYSPDWPQAGAERGWGHFSSTDLVHWEHHGYALGQDTPADASGAYSGSAVVIPGGGSDGSDLLRLYYTGNVKLPGEHDFVHEGREANQILVESPDGFGLGEKRVLLTNADYPASCSCHVRDPKVWREGGAWWMLLGARSEDDEGFAFVMRSEDGLAWRQARELHGAQRLGYMWECPDRIALGGREWLSFCPQGVEDEPWSCGLRDGSGYVALPEGARVAGAGGAADPEAAPAVEPAAAPDSLALDLAGYTPWDRGFEFYAPQTFVDEAGRTILIGWMGLPEPPFDEAPYGMGWCNCLTVPRQLEAGEDGRLLQRPVPELELLRGEGVALGAGGAAAVLPEHRADVVVSGIEGDLRLSLDDALVVECEGGRVALRFTDTRAAAGRGVRTAACTARDLRVLVDDSAVEVYVNGGETVFSTRWFPQEGPLTLALAARFDEATAWPMGDGMQGAY